MNNFELKIDFSYKFCNAAYLEKLDDDNTVAFYF